LAGEAPARRFPDILSGALPPEIDARSFASQPSRAGWFVVFVPPWPPENCGGFLIVRNTWSRKGADSARGAHHRISRLWLVAPRWNPDQPGRVSFFSSISLSSWA